MVPYHFLKTLAPSRARNRCRLEATYRQWVLQQIGVSVRRVPQGAGTTPKVPRTHHPKVPRISELCR